MCKSLAITIGTMLLTTIVHGQPVRMNSVWLEATRQEIWKNEIKRFKIKSVTAICEGKVRSIHFYDDYGDLLRVESESDSAIGKVAVTNVFIYDNARQLIETRMINSKDQIYRVVTYSYNSKGQLIKKEWSASDKHNEATWTYDYDRHGNKIKETQESLILGYSLTNFRYVNGRLTVSETSDDLLGKAKRLSYKYNKRGQVTKRKMINYLLYNNTNILRYSYNKAGKLATLKERDSVWDPSITTYEYNDKGLLETETWKSSPEMESGTITYIVGY